MSDVWQGSEYANEYCCKILSEYYFLSTGKHRNKGVYWYEKSYLLSTYHGYISCSDFILLVLPQVFTELLFYWKCSLSIQQPSLPEEYLELSQTSMLVLFCENRQRLLDVDYFRTKSLSLMFDRVLNLPLTTIQGLFRTRICLKNCFFLRIIIKRET